MTKPEQDPEFADFVALRYRDLLRTAYLLTGSHHAAEDLVQACLLKAMPRWDRIAEPTTYLRRVMVNQRVSWWRRLRRELPQADPPDSVVPDDAGGAAERTVVLAALAGLPPRMRAVLVLRYWEDLSEAETADLLGCSTGTVKAQASRGLARLRTVLGAAPAETHARGNR
ncbi:SigE family RNA polymerase sigma factor [Virgisporangium ochraceum]|uniref:DNA-directed RNA polymerase sigma-70 factor n=1 Tax=Virgisporangium ochraceum TaxID=65505 RepID=A0A8J3ZXM8_9ACTN|nr:SigE family RNA polymerase sigma factor [Virgisporangium ochraceum]GIJ69261.1 DNA-directed RNA polymerase sigma-70 factor [Virgisporangium ochraceum]